MLAPVTALQHQDQHPLSLALSQVPVLSAHYPNRTRYQPLPPQQEGMHVSAARCTVSWLGSVFLETVLIEKNLKQRSDHWKVNTVIQFLECHKWL